MPPRTAYSPASRTVDARMNPLSSSQRTMPSMASTLPGAADSPCPATSARAGTRCTTALTVASRTEGRDCGAACALRWASRDSVVMRWAMTAAWGDARSYGWQSHAGNSSTPISGAKKASARELRHAAAVTADDQQACRGRVGLRRDCARKVGEHQPLGAVGDARDGQRPALLHEIGG